MFVEFQDIDDANLALATIHNHAFDARHTFKVNRFTDTEKYALMDETYSEPELSEYIPKVKDQRVIHHITEFDGIHSGAFTSVACRSTRTGSICHIPWRRGLDSLARKALAMRSSL